MNRNRGLLTAAVPLLLLGACAQPGAAGDKTAGAPVVESTTASADPKQVVLRVEYRGGFVPAELIPSRLPRFTAYADGRLLSEGPVPLIYPGKALPNLQEVRLGPERLRELIAEAVAAGVKTGTDFGMPGIADAPSTRITVVTAGGEQVADVMALNEARPDDGALTKEQNAARKRLTGFLDELDAEFAGSTSPAPAQYRAERVAVLAHPYVDTGDGAGGSPVRWPGPDLPGGYLNEQLKINCLTVEGTAKDAVWAAAEKANERTPWESAGKKWQVRFRPLLPEETGCDSLLRQE
ncbi:hypothetical protein GCM10010112_27800 [Actinoplanes lobatus]|uniref:Lipoprotein n=1 Tax=Actinoplanes lobatus TaxID=113568 RepID=A0A7W7HPX7_9ACTN|nr:hypothetical protein [Actinoplanes lobatus]MBB4754490.1 hypothetical protein [Actinoplanes lobatus]GGN65901.1 hypothetical protein GCM10010112_27800 [Actinoplanes lobatus]GIE40435.1 hypothetical protein Alo02nite_33330 [Actinoplanes lobatus]